MTRQDVALVSTEGVLEWDGLQTWYRIVGELDIASHLTPVVIVHGGPGATHDYVEPLAELAHDGRACILYDQVGCGRSSHHPDVPRGFWTVELFERELETLVDHLGLGSYHLLGQSWGAMLGLEHALRRPDGLCSLILANGTASVPMYIEENAKLLRALPDGAGEALINHGRDGTTDDAEFQEAIVLYSRLHRLRVDEMPEPLQRTNQAIDADPSVYLATVGSEFFVTGTIRDWDVTDRLGEINVPTLIITGGHDEMPPSLAEAMHRHVHGSELVIFEDASHMIHLEEPKRFLATVEEFLARIETSTTTGGTIMKTDSASPIEPDQGAALIDALRRGDLDDVRDLLAPDIHVRGLLPGKTTEADDRDAAVAMFAEGFINEAMQRLDVVSTDRVGDRGFIAYRGQWSMPEHGTNVFEQHAFYDTDSEGRISWMHLVCSGNHPVSTM